MIPNADKAPAAAEKVALMELGREYRLGELRPLGLYGDTLTRAVRHGMVFRVGVRSKPHNRPIYYVRSPDVQEAQ